MTDQQKPPAVPDADLEALAEQLIASVNDYLDGEPVDLEGPVDALVDALAGSTSDATLATVLESVRAIVERFWNHMRSMGGQPAAAALAGGLLSGLRTSLFGAINPFDGQGDLLAAEQAVSDLEDVARAARERLEDAVERGDIAEVLKLRADAEVAAPGQLAEARARLLELRLAAAEHQQSRAGSAHDRAARRALTAKAAAEKAAAELRRLAQLADEAMFEAEGVARTKLDVSLQVRQLREELDEFRTAHAREQQARIRQFAGLAPAA